MKRLGMLLLLLIVAAPGLWALEYQVIDLGLGEFAWASALNDAGQIAGYGYNAEGEICGFRLNGDGSIQTFESCHVYDISQTGIVAGQLMTKKGFVAGRWEKNRTKALKSLGDYSWAMAANSRGLVVGGSGKPVPNGSVSRPCLWQGNRIIDLAGSGAGWAKDINDDGQIVGTVDTGAGNRAMVWQFSKGRLRSQKDIGPGYANSINAGGQVVGYKMTGMTAEPFFWDSGQRWALPILGASSWAIKINNAGLIIGNWDSSSDYGVVLWRDGQAVNLNSVIANSGWRLVIAQDINDAGEILCRGWQPGQSPRSLLLIPIK